MTGSNYYNLHAPKIFAEYEAYDAAALYGTLSSYVRPRLRVLDIGAGSGRDARWYAEQECVVTAVEPATALLALAKAKSATDAMASVRSIEWLSDSLPALRTLKDRTFDLIHMAGVWMHIAPSERVAALDRLYDLLADDGCFYCGIRQGPDTKGRGLHDTADDDVIFTDNRFKQLHQDRENVFRYDVDTVWIRTIRQKLAMSER